MLNKERFATKLHQDYQQTDHFASTHASRFGSGKFSMQGEFSNQIKNILNNDLSKTQASGFYKTDYLKDEVNHFSNPPYCIIKPGYRASLPFPNHN
jgi:hypothetical protein